MKKLALLLVFAASTAFALPDAVRNADPRWQQQDSRENLRWQQWGSGEMRWFGFSLYRATLWVAGKGPEQAPSALQLDYHRDIPRERLVETSLDEMRRLGASEAQLQRWASALERVFPDVKAGDCIVGIHIPGRGARFYYGDAVSGEIDDPEFARHFFAIWLDEQSRSPDLRAALLTPPKSGG